MPSPDGSGEAALVSGVRRLASGQCTLEKTSQMERSEVKANTALQELLWENRCVCDLNPTCRGAVAPPRASLHGVHLLLNGEGGTLIDHGCP